MQYMQYDFYEVVIGVYIQACDLLFSVSNIYINISDICLCIIYL